MRLPVTFNWPAGDALKRVSCQCARSYGHVQFCGVNSGEDLLFLQKKSFKHIWYTTQIAENVSVWAICTKYSHARCGFLWCTSRGVVRFFALSDVYEIRPPAYQVVCVSAVTSKEATCTVAYMWFPGYGHIPDYVKKTFNYLTVWTRGSAIWGLCAAAVIVLDILSRGKYLLMLLTNFPLPCFSLQTKAFTNKQVREIYCYHVYHGINNAANYCRSVVFNKN